MTDRLLYVFEDDDYENFYPLTVNRAVFQLRLGVDLLYEKWEAHFPNSNLRFCIRNHLADLTMSKIEAACNRFEGVADSGAIFINGRFIPDEQLVEEIGSIELPKLLLCNGNLVAAVVPPNSDESRNLELMRYWGYGHFKEIIKRIPKSDVNAREVKYIWDFINMNPQQISLDFDRFKKKLQTDLISTSANIDDDCLIYNRDAVRIGDGVRIDGHVVIDARGGPVFVDSGVIIEPHTRIEGPCYVGRDTMLVGGKIREGCSIGPRCKVGGELEESIILGYSNKFHDGFLGHSYLGEWVNLGAMTTNSDLKNNYGTIRVDRGDGLVDTGIRKLGAFIGDHAKTGIGTMLNTGITIGLASNIFGAGLVVDKFVPPFCWGGTGNYDVYDIERAIKTAKVVTKRRNVMFTDLDEKVFRSVFEESAPQRKRVIEDNKDRFG